MADQLKACPMCGKSVAVVTTSAEMWPDYEDDGCADSFAVMCDASAPNGPGGCGASGGFAPTEAKAIAAWNTRSEPVGVPTVQAGEPIAYYFEYEDEDGTQRMYNGHNQFPGGSKGKPLYAAPSQPVAGKPSDEQIKQRIWQIANNLGEATSGFESQRDVDAINGYIEELFALTTANAGKDAQTEYGWLVENGRDVPDLRYRTMDNSGITWTDDHNKALRFARRADAEMFAAEDEDAWRIVQHAWDTVDEVKP